MKPTWKVAHRGWHKMHVENTLEAFRAAYDAGCDMVEFDVQLTRDGIPVVFHDDDCRRLAGLHDNVFDLEWKELRTLSMPGRSGSGGLLGYKIPSLERFLAEFGTRAFYLELKIPRAVSGNKGYVEMLAEKCASMVKAAGPHPDTFLGSFHEGILRFTSQRNLFPSLAGIFEDYSRFEDVHSGKDAETAAAIRHFSVSWSVFKRYLRESSAASERAARHARNKPSDPDPFTRKDEAARGTELFLIWDIHGEADFREALGRGVRGLVADDVETMVRVVDSAGRAADAGASP